MKRKSTILMSLVYVIFSTSVFAQNGPGGLGNTNGSSDLFIWLDANQIKDIYDQNNISIWLDASGYENNAIQSNSSAKPNYYENTLNGFPVLNFDGTEYLEGSLTEALAAPVTLIAVGYFNNDQGVTDDDYIFSTGAQNIEGRMFGISRRRNDGSNQNRFYSYDGGTRRFGPTINRQEWKLFTQYMDNSDPEHRLYIDGSLQTVDDYPTPLSNSNDFGVGIWSDHVGNGEQVLDGQIAEIILFRKVLGSTERNIVESYLSAKYNILIDAATDKYIGDTTPNFDFDVVGIGGDPTDPDNRVLSANSKGLILSQSSNFVDGDYLMAGHNITTNSINTSDINDDDTGGGSGIVLESRWERQWWIDITDPGADNTSSISFDMSNAGFGNSLSGSSSNYKLLYRSTNNPGDDWTISTLVPTITGDRIIFSGVNITTQGGDGYYTVGTTSNTNSPLGTTPASLGFDGPGGVGSRDGTSDLKLWLDASEISGTTGDFILTAEDKSGNGNDASAAGIAIPLLVSSSANGNNTIAFNGGSHYMSGAITGGLNAPATVIAVPYFAKASQNNTNDYVISIGASSGINDHMSISRRNNVSSSGADVDKYYSFDGISPASAAGVHLSGAGETISGQTWTIITQAQKQGAIRHAAFVDGTPFNVDDFNGDFASNGSYEIGRFVLGNNYFGGELAETIVFDKVLNTAELNIVHSYLGAKYEVTVLGDKYDGDNSSGPNYDMDVAGVGSESADCSLGGAECNLTASSAGLKIEQNSGFEVGDYVMIGHNSSSNSINTIDIIANSATLNQRSSRNWYFTITDASTTATIDITFDISDADLTTFPAGIATNYKIIYRPNSSGNWNVVGEASTLANDQIFFTNISTSNGNGYYTVATIDSGESPLPVELVSFDANVVNNKVQIYWQTATEVNNDHFDIERSVDGKRFENINTVKGKGQSTHLTEYSIYDPSPLSGYSYYRLKQVDFDGTHEYSKIVNVFFERKPSLALYPNPTNSILKYSGTDLPTKVQAISVSGKLLIDLPFTRNEINTSQLQPGIYIVIFEIGSQVIKKRVSIYR